MFHKNIPEARAGLPIAFEAGMKFAIREGGKTVGAGVVLTTGA